MSGSDQSVQRISIEEYLNLSPRPPLIDVRSPGEHLQGHIPGAANIPLFDNDERARVGTVYTKKSREAAIELGYTFVEPKLESFISGSRSVAPGGITAVHCWRGGMRSEAFAGYLAENGFVKLYVIEGGYKAFRRLVLASFQAPLNLSVLGGYTGSGKTDILKSLRESGEQIIDLEGLARHKGSAFGALGEKAQPGNEQFENDLFMEIRKLNPRRRIWVEDESINIGSVSIPKAFFEQMGASPLVFVDIPREERVPFLVEVYGIFPREELEAAITRIRKRLGGEATARALEALHAGDLYSVARLSLQYYDKAYRYSLDRREPDSITVVPLPTIDPRRNAEALLDTGSTAGPGGTVPDGAVPDT